MVTDLDNCGFQFDQILKGNLARYTAAATLSKLKLVSRNYTFSANLWLNGDQQCIVGPTQFVQYPVTVPIDLNDVKEVFS